MNLDLKSWLQNWLPPGLADRTGGLQQLEGGLTSAGLPPEVRPPTHRDRPSFSPTWPPSDNHAWILQILSLYFHCICKQSSIWSTWSLPVNQSWIFKCCLCICDVFILHLYLLAAALCAILASDRHLDIANITNFCCIWTCSPTPGKADLWQMTAFELQILLLYLCWICICIELAALLVTTALGVCKCKIFVLYLYFY